MLTGRHDDATVNATSQERSSGRDCTPALTRSWSFRHHAPLCNPGYTTRVTLVTQSRAPEVLAPKA